MKRKRGFSTFSLSFLDIMSCGFGAVVLVFLIIKHDVDSKVEVDSVALQSEVNLLMDDIKLGEDQLVSIKNTVSTLDQQLVTAQGLARRINEEINAVKNKVEQLGIDESDQDLQELKARLKTLADQKKKLETEQDQGNNVRRYLGQGDRQYLTGLNLGGRRVLILLDSSSSMLDETIVNIIRRKYMSDDTKRASHKWQRAISATEWLVAQLPVDSHYQIYHFNSRSMPLIKGSMGNWLTSSNQAQLDETMLNLKKVVPDGATSLINAFVAATQLNPLPDNIFLLTDGLPTQGYNSHDGNTVSPQDRLEYFKSALKVLPIGIPVNVLLWPMEGDPLAASAFWRLSQLSAGSFISPSRDWP